MISTTFDGVKDLVGQDIGIGEWLLIDQERINQFADATGDHQWIHVDVERANKEIGGTIAHGFLTLSLIPSLVAGLLQIEGASRSLNYGCNKVRFTNAVPAGCKIRARQKLLNIEERSGGLQLTKEVVVEIEGEKRPACVAELVSIIYN